MPEMLETNLNFDTTSAGALVAPGGKVFIKMGETYGFQEVAPIDDEFSVDFARNRISYEKNGNPDWFNKITSQGVTIKGSFLTAGCLKAILLVLGYDPNIINSSDPTKLKAVLDALPNAPFFEAKVVIPRVDGKDVVYHFARAQFFSDAVSTALTKSEPAKLAFEIKGIINPNSTLGFDFLRVEQEL